MPKNTNIAPYYDDFDSLKSFYQLLFRPGYSVQARELTQIQSILQDQITKFGNHIFKNGSLVVGAQTTINRGAKFLKIKSTNNGETIQNGGTTVNILNFLNKRIDIFDETGTTQVAKAVVTLTAGSDTLIISEIFGDFSAIVGNAHVRIEGSASSQDAEIQETAFYGKATTASINDGIFFIDGFFCVVNSQTIVVDYTDIPSKKVGIDVNYIVVDDSSDNSLLDPAAGFSNYASPGAHRLKIELLLETRDIDSADNLTDFYELIRLENGEILKQIIYPQYSDIEKMLERRTYDESGDYTVRPFLVQPLNSFKGTGTITVSAGTVSGTNTLFTEELATGSVIEADGKEFTVVGNVENNLQVSVTPTSGENSTVVSASRFLVKDGKKINLRISPGKAYVKGAEFETISPNNILIDKAREIVNVSRHDFSVAYGSYVVCSVMAANFNFSVLENVQLLDYDNNVIGLANVRMIESEGTNYRVYLFNVKMSSGKFFETVRKIAKYGSTAQTATILIDGIGATESTGTGNVTVSGTTATGTGTKFQTELRVGSRIVINNVAYDVTVITSDTQLTLSSSATVSIPTSFRIRDTRIYGNTNQEWIIPVGFFGMSPVIDDGVTPTFANTAYYLRNYNTVSGGGSGIQELQFTINSPYEFLPGLSNFQLIQIGATNGDPCVDLTSTLTGATVSNSVSNSTVTISRGTDFDDATYCLYATVKAESPDPRTKTFRRYSTTISLSDNLSSGRRYVSAYDFATNDYRFSLNKSDVINAEKIYLNPVVSGNEITGGEDITLMFTFDNGQRDTHYDHASITLKPEFRANFPVGNILVLFNYWEHSRSIGAIVTRSYNDYKKIPTYYSSVSGRAFNLRDCVDFRPIVPDNTPINNENVFPAAMFASFFSEFPLNNSNFEADAAYYLPRKDRLVISKEKRFEVLKGISDENPKLPQSNSDSMTIYNISLNPYTYNQNDLFLEFIENKRYTMRDIGRIEKRIGNLEYYTALTLLEKETADLLVRDGAGNSRFKNGFIAENFSGHNIGDVDRADYSCSIDFENRQLRPRFKSRNFKLEHTSSTISTESVGNKPVKKGNILLIPYTSNFKMVSQLQASGFLNVNPYNVFSWVGQMQLNPASDVWVETNKRPDVILNIDNTNDNFLSQNFEGTRWNEWETTWTGIEILDQSSISSVGVAPIFRVDPTGNMDFDTIIGENIRRDTITTENFVQTGQRTRTGISSSLTSTITEESRGERIVDVSVIPFMRAAQIAVVATSLKPNTRVYVFFDDVNVSSIVTGNSPYVISGTLKTDSAGTFIGTINIPNPNSSATFRFRTGNKTVRITDSSLNELTTSTTMAEGIFSSSGTINTVEETIARIRNFEIQNQILTETQNISSNPINRIVSRTSEFSENLFEQAPVVTWIDPLAQTFLVDPSVYKEGVFLSKVKLFFRSKDNSLPVTVQIRPTVNGFPHSSFVMPFGSKTVLPASVNIPPSNLNNNNTQILNYGTTIEFDSPIYLQPGEYSVVILSNSNNYEVYTAEIGQKRLGSTEVISEQPYAGSLFTSQNSSTWTPEQNLDLVFELFLCEFSTNTNVFAEFVENKPYSDMTYMSLIKIGDTIQTFPSCSLSHSYISKNVTDVSYNASVNNFVPISPNNNVFLKNEKEITGEASENFRYRTIMRTANKFVSPIIDSERTNLICVENLVNNATDVLSFTHASTDGPSFVSGANQTVGSNTGIVYDYEISKFVFNGSDANIVSVANNTISIENHGFITGNKVIYGNGGGTSITGLSNSAVYFVIKVDNDTIKLATSAANAIAGTAQDITGLGVGTDHIIISESGKLFLKKTSSGYFAPAETFTSANAVLCTITAVSSETDAEFGGSETRYFTRVANLKNNNDYLKVYLTANKPAGTDIRVYYKVAKTEDANTINNLPYVEMVQEEPNSNVFSNSDRDLIEFVFSPNEATSIGEFNRLVVKIVLLSDNKCVVPFVKDMRAIVLDME